MVRSPKLCQERDRFLDKTDSRGLWRVPDEAREGLQLPETDFFHVMDSLRLPTGTAQTDGPLEAAFGV